MASSRILDSRYSDKLSANRLEALSIKSDNIKPSSGTSGPSDSSDSSGPGGPSFLFSLLLKDATFTPNNTGGTLTFDLPLHSGDNVIMFSDRPFRQTSFISFTEFISDFTSDNSNNSFEKDPPNAVLVHSEEQRTYIVRYSKSDSSSDSSNSSTVTFNLELLPGETNVSLEVITGRMNLFVDSLNSTSIEHNISAAENYVKNGEYQLAAGNYQLAGKYYTNIHNYEFAVKYYKLAGQYYIYIVNYTDIPNYNLAAENYKLAAANYTNIPNYKLAGKYYDLASQYYQYVGDNELAKLMYRLANRNLNFNRNGPH